MSGIFGFVSNNDYNQSAIAVHMGRSMCYRDWYQCDTYTDEKLPAVIGRIGIGIFNRIQQPIWNPEHTVALVMAGEFYPSQAEPKGGDEQLALSYYQKYGERFASRLNGAFIIAILDRLQKKVVICNDRFGLYPLYYSSRGKSLAFAPEVKAILATEAVPLKLDLVALAQYMRFQHILGLRTFFEDINLFPGASFLVYDIPSGDHRLQTYWTYADIPDRPQVSFSEAVEEGGALLRGIVERLSGDEYRPGVFLSGGLDSRTILGLTEHRPIVSHTYGVKNCRDVRFAAQIAETVGSEHYWHNFENGSWIPENVQFHLDLTEGFHSWIHAHGISILPEVRKTMDVNLTGWDGGTVMGDAEIIESLVSEAVDHTALTSLMFQRFNQQFTWPSITEAEERSLYTDEIFKQIRGIALDSFRTEFAPYQQYRKDLRAELFYVVNHCRRLTQNMVKIARSHIEVRCPFFDYDLTDFLYSIPSHVRGHKALYRAIIQRETPRLAYIPYDHDEFLPTTHSLLRSTHALTIKAMRRIRKLTRLKRPQDTLLYADYEEYLRGDLKEWGQKILFDPCLLNRGIFNPTFIQSIWDRHQSGMEQWTIGKIAPIMTYEMMLQRFYG